MKKITIVSLIALFFMTAASFAQGVTTSSISGRVLDNTENPLPGANIVATHVPTGSVYGAVTDFDGFYRLTNLKPGGPYNITITYVGFEDYTLNGFSLSLGETKRVSAGLSEAANALDEIVITAQANSIFDANKTGSETSISQRQVDALPNISRSIADFARLTPEAQLRGDNELSIAGQNNRYNALYVDGAVNNDTFGLSGSGTNGGQTGVNPISIDAIESFQVNVAPYDVTIGGFAGGAISAVTKSGSNKFEGSAYYLFRNQDLAGKTPGDVDEREKLAEFTANTFGVRAGGPIIKDKLFFFVNYEGQNDETPQPFDGEYAGESGLEGVSQFRQFVLDEYGYDVGSFENNTRTLESNKILFKIDWNINDNHKLSFRNNLVQADFFGIGRSSARTINFTSGAQNFESTTNTASLELNSTFGSKYANRFIFGYTRVRDDRGINGSPFPRIEINDGDARIFGGSEPFSTANLLEQDIFTLTNNFQIFSGRHTVTLGTHNEYSKVKNVFFGRNFGEYTYNSLQDFFDDDANEYRSSYSLLGGSGDESIGAAEFDLFQLGFYAQDEVQLSETFKMTAGLRVDLPVWDDGRGNEDFNTRTVNLLQAAGKDLKGARVGQGPKTMAHISPRLGFNWDVKGDKTTQIRGGLGLFTSRIPLVWPGGAYNNTGTVVANTRIFRPRNDEDPNLVPSFNPDVTTQFRQEGEFQGNIDLLAEDLMLPQVFKKSFAVDQKLGKGFTLSGEISHNSVITGLNLENLNLEGPQFTTTGAGGRLNYGDVRIDNTYQDIFLISNTNEGESYNASVTLANNFYSTKVDVRSSATYSYGRATTVFEGTSSQNISNWAFNESVNGSNALGTSISDFSQGHRTLANAVVDIKWNENIKTSIGLFYQGAEGTPFSYVVGGGRSNQLIDDTGESFLALPFVPETFADANLVDITDGDGNVLVSAEDQFTALDAFIESDDYLRGRRGNFAERNSNRARWSHVVDLKFTQDFALNIGEQKHTFQFSADIFNFTNLVNKDWGRRFFTSGFDTATLVNFVGFADDGTTPEYTFNDGVEAGLNQVDDAGFNSSRWQMQLGLRYIFN